MRRILLTIQYDGTDYVGWQRQINGVSIQEKLEKVLSVCEKMPIRITGASRTDAGVHARSQHAHFDTLSNIPTEKYPFVFNSMLPRDISVSKAIEVDTSFNARFSAKGKEYIYKMDNARHADALKSRFYAHIPLPLDEEKMQKALQDIVGTHDFKAFEAAGGTSKTTLRTIFSASITRAEDDVVLRVYGNAFLYNMVRIIAGTLIEIGHERLPVDAFQNAIESGNRLCLGPTAPAKGLLLYRMDYDFGGANE